ncbi:MAG: hypothetical protein WKG07_23795 [Hymenobacter sp.]
MGLEYVGLTGLRFPHRQADRNRKARRQLLELVFERGGVVDVGPRVAEVYFQSKGRAQRRQKLRHPGRSADHRHLGDLAGQVRLLSVKVQRTADFGNERIDHRFGRLGNLAFQFVGLQSEVALELLGAVGVDAQALRDRAGQRPAAGGGVAV